MCSGFSNIYAVKPVRKPPDVKIAVPGSKSITNRALLLSAFADGKSVLRNALSSDDTHVFIDCLIRLGFAVNRLDDTAIEIEGKGCVPPHKKVDLFVGNAGTACRFFIPACVTSEGAFTFDGTERMRERPLRELLESLKKLGAEFSPPGRINLPIELKTSGLSGGTISVDTSRSGQFLSGIMMASIRAKNDLSISREGGLVGKPYIDITFEMLKSFGIPVSREGYEEFKAPAGFRYSGREYDIEPDASTASYFFAAAALTGGKVTVEGLWRSSSIQGDIRFLDILETMGCRINRTPEGTEVIGKSSLKGVDVDMADISDTFMTLAVIAPFAETPTRIKGIAHTRGQESDRVTAISTELTRLGAKIVAGEDSIRILPSRLSGGEVKTYNDHRIAMAMSLAGLRTPGVTITGADCVNKTAPEYFRLFNMLERSGGNE